MKEHQSKLIDALALWRICYTQSLGQYGLTTPAEQIQPTLYSTSLKKVEIHQFFLNLSGELRRLDCQKLARGLQWGKPNLANSLFFHRCFAFLSVFRRFRE